MSRLVELCPTCGNHRYATYSDPTVIHWRCKCGTTREELNQ